MIKVNVTKQRNYPVSAAKIKKHLAKFFEGSGVVSNAEVSVAIVGAKKMADISKKYLKDTKVHDVLSFVEGEAKAEFVYPENGFLKLGEIVICFPEVQKKANTEDRLTEDIVLSLLTHGGEHLMGKHHE